MALSNPSIYYVAAALYYGDSRNSICFGPIFSCRNPVYFDGVIRCACITPAACEAIIAAFLSIFVSPPLSFGPIFYAAAGPRNSYSYTEYPLLKPYNLSPSS